MSQLPEPFGYIYDGDPTGVKFTRELTMFHELLCSTAPVFSLSQLQAYVEQTIAYKEAEILRLHAKLAGQTLRADQGWARYEAANKGRLERDQLASVKQEPLSGTENTVAAQLAELVIAYRDAKRKVDALPEDAYLRGGLYALTSAIAERDGAEFQLFDFVEQLGSLPSARPIPAQQPQWLPIESAPKDEGISFLVLLPGNDMADSIVLQVSNFEGNMYPDYKDGAIDYDDRVTTATHWMPQHQSPVVDGWKWVPLEPTAEMLQAAWSKANELWNTPEGDDPLPRHQYKAMLEAAPSPIIDSEVAP